jgi:processive 1,2-diacylglycerol beta-glucosyltransferase
MAIPRILILTASFGDGHNSAARALASALAGLAGDAAEVEVRDLIREAEPFTSPALESLYRFAITHAPWGWHQFYRVAAHLPMDRDPLMVLSRVSTTLARTIRDRPPAAVLATFPLYAHQLQRLLSRPAFPVFTAVTDSITIHPIWINGVTTTYFAPDEVSAASLRRSVPPDVAVLDTGFPVSPVFAEIPVQPAADPPRRVLYFPATAKGVARRALDSLLRHTPPDLALTVVLGRHADRLGPVVDQCLAGFPGRPVEVLGWTDQVPRLMTSHDLVIAKAGGATTHECCAAGRPLVITKVVPGQEEGNAELVQRRRSGVHEQSPEQLGPLIARLSSPGEWVRLRDAAWRHRRPAGARTAARHVLDHLGVIPPGNPAPPA